MPDNNKPTLLIVDDDPLISDTLSYALGKDFEVMVNWPWWTSGCRRRRTGPTRASS